jgi:hypothetical protein
VATCRSSGQPVPRDGDPTPCLYAIFMRGNIPQRNRYQTLRSSSDPRGRLRGGAAGAVAFGDAVAVDLGAGGMIGAATGGVVRMRAGCMFVARPAGAWVEPAAGAACPGEAVACAIPMNVAGDNMGEAYDQRGKRTIKTLWVNREEFAASTKPPTPLWSLTAVKVTSRPRPFGTTTRLRSAAGWNGSPHELFVFWELALKAHHGV